MWPSWDWHGVSLAGVRFRRPIPGPGFGTVVEDGRACVLENPLDGPAG